MTFRNVLTKFTALVLVAAMCFSPVFSSEVRADDGVQEEQLAEGQTVEKQADSWRYSEGQVLEEEEADANMEEADGADPEEKAGADTEEETLQAMAAGKYQYGIDVSYWQKTIDWAKVKAAGVDFAIIRCGYGSNITKNDDSYFIKNVKGCMKNGIPYGVYFYSYAKNTAMAKDEAEHTIRLLQGLQPDLPVYYDLEDSTVKSAGNSTIQKMAQTYCSILEENGYNAGVYANLDWWKNRIGTAADGYDKWVAQWNSSCSYSGKCSMWQNSSSGKVAGISGRVDTDWIISDEIFFGNSVEPEERYISQSTVSRKGPSTRYAGKASLKWGQSVTVTGTYGSYVKLSDESWLNESYLATADSPKEFVEEEGKQILKSYSGETLTNRWAVVNDVKYYVDGNGEIVKNTWMWIGCRQYRFGSDGRTFINKSKAKKKAAAYRKPGSSKAGTIKKNSKFYVLQKSGKWSQMANGLWIKTCYTKKVAVYPNVKPSVSKSYRTKMKKRYGAYTGPSTSYIKKKTYRKNRKVKVIGWYGSWAKLSTGYWVPRSKLR